MGAMMVLPFFQQREDQIKFEVLDEDLKEIEALRGSPEPLLAWR